MALSRRRPHRRARAPRPGSAATEKGAPANRTMAIGNLGGATLDNEENYLIKKLLTSPSASSRSRTRRAYDTPPRCPVWAPRSDEAARPPSSRISQNADCVLIMGSNMAENHPVGFQWVMEARERGAKVLHVDPRFTRTSAMATQHVAIRAGSDIAFLGGVANYILENDLWLPRVRPALHERAGDHPRGVRRHRGARRPLLRLGPGEGRVRRRRRWMYEGMELHGSAGQREEGFKPTKGEGSGHGGAGGGLVARRAARGGPVDGASALRPPDPQAPLRPLHARVRRRDVRLLGRGLPRGLPRRSSRTPAASARRAFCYAVGWTQHTVGVQTIRAAAIVQQLLGNIGRPGGGILALRGHASIQGSTDIPTLYNILPGYLPMPHTEKYGDLDRATSRRTPRRPAGGATSGAYFVSLMKAYFGEHATADNDFLFDSLPRIDDDNSAYFTVEQMLEGDREGLHHRRREPGGRARERQGAPARALQPRLARRARPRRDRVGVLLVRQPRGRVGRAARRRRSGPRSSSCPAAAHTEKDGSFTNTQRLLQWHSQAVEPKDDCRSELWFYFHLGRLIKRAASPTPRRSATDSSRRSAGSTRPTRRSGSRAPRPCCRR